MTLHLEPNPYESPETHKPAVNPATRVRSRSWFEIVILSAVGGAAVVMSLFTGVMCVAFTFFEKDKLIVAPIILASGAMFAAAGLFLFRRAWTWSRVNHDGADP